MILRSTLAVVLLAASACSQRVECGGNAVVTGLKVTPTGQVVLRCMGMETVSGKKVLVIRRHGGFQPVGQMSPLRACLDGEIVSGYRKVTRNGVSIVSVTCTTTLNARTKLEQGSLIRQTMELTPGTQFELPPGQYLLNMVMEPGRNVNLLKYTAGTLRLDDYDFAEYQTPLDESNGCMCLCTAVCPRKEKPQPPWWGKEEEAEKSGEGSKEKSEKSEKTGSKKSGSEKSGSKESGSKKSGSKESGSNKSGRRRNTFARRLRVRQQRDVEHLREKRQLRIVNARPGTTKTEEMVKINVAYTLKVDKRANGITAFIFEPEREVKPCPEEMCNCGCMCNENNPWPEEQVTTTETAWREGEEAEEECEEDEDGRQGNQGQGRGQGPPTKSCKPRKGRQRPKAPTGRRRLGRQ